jgi:drug/metabolite transporter (DMT)-like permease
MTILLAAFPRRAHARLARADVPVLAAASAAGAVAAPFCYLQGLAVAPANVTALLLNLEVVFTAAVAVAVAGERLDARRALGVGLVVVGSVALSAFGEDGGGGAAGGGSAGGGAWVALACLLWAVDNNLTRRIAAKDPVRIARWKAVAGGVASLALAAALGVPFPTEPGPWVAGAVLGLLLYGASLVLFVVGIRALGAARATAVFGVHPFLGAVASAVVLGEALTPALAGVAVVLAAGVALVAWEPRASPERAGAAPPAVPYASAPPPPEDEP